MPVNLSVNYMGFTLKNPIVVGSSSLTGNIDKCAMCEQAGAAAVVLKSLFEEQIMADAARIESEAAKSYHPEAMDYIYSTGYEHSRANYLTFIKDASKHLSIPAIASLNCVGRGSWFDYARRIEDSGANGIELNIYVVPKKSDADSASIEQIYVDIVRGVLEKVRIPVSVNLSPFFTNFYSMTERLAAAGAKSIVIFNRYYHFDIDLEHMKLVPGKTFSTPDEMYLSLKWMALLSGRIHCDLSATTGISDGEAILKQVLAGAKTVQVASALYTNGVNYIETMLHQLEDAMNKHHIDSIDSIRGNLSRTMSDHPAMYDRVQFIKDFVGLE